jgi:hypothetical protein
VLISSSQLVNNRSVSFLHTISKISVAIFAFRLLTHLRLPCTCLHPADENHRVAERIAALEKVSKGASSLWADPWLRSAVILLQDRAQHIGEAVNGCQRALTTMYWLLGCESRSYCNCGISSFGLHICFLYHPLVIMSIYCCTHLLYLQICFLYPLNLILFST